MNKIDFNFTSRDEKKKYVRQMFSNIAGRYDFLNHFLSVGQDYRWRRIAVGIVAKHLVNIAHPQILDIACGTGDLSFEVLRQIPSAHITGIDLAKPMLDVFQEKISKRSVRITISEGDVEALQFPDNTFDAVTIGFGTRNFTTLDIAFAEIYRVMKPGGIFVNLELSKPRHFPMKQFYSFYSKFILPLIGKGVSKHGEAYSYLPDSVQKFPEREQIISLLTTIGFKNARWRDLSAGIVTMHLGEK